MELERCRSRAAETGDACVASSQTDAAVDRAALTAAEEAEAGERAASTPAASPVRSAATRTALVLGGAVAAADRSECSSPLQR